MIAFIPGKFYIKTILLPVFLLSGFQQLPEGKEIYEKKCARCHGKAGTRTLFGTKSLQKSKMEDAEIIKIIHAGKRNMPSYRSKLTDTEIKQIVVYIKHLRK